MTGCSIFMQNVTGQGGWPAGHGPTGQYVPASGTNVPNYCIYGCVCGFGGNGSAYDTAGCVNAVP
jgi:hypothetical protein